MKANTVLILSHHHPILIEELEALKYNVCIDLQPNWQNPSFSFESIIGIVTSNTCFLPKEKIELFPNLKFIGRLGSGMEIIDTKFAHQQGIICFGSPEGNANAVAEHALGLLIGVLRNIRKSNDELIQGRFLRKENMGRELQDCKVGILGFGSNGQQFAQHLLHFGAQVYAHDCEEKSFIPHENLHFSTAISDLVNNCDVLSFHLPIDNAAKEKSNQVLNDMKQPFILINCARGKLMDVDLLFEMLVNRKIIAAGIDVWEEEPLDLLPKKKFEKVKQILSMPQVIATAHIAGYSHQATYKMSKVIADKIKTLKF